MLQDINKALLIYLNNFWQIDWIKDIVFIFADTPIFFLPLFLLGYWIYWWKKDKREKQEDLIFIFYWVIIALIFALIIQKFIHIDRPETALDNAWKLLLKHIPDASFPSDHATVSVAFLVWLFLAHYKKTFFYFLPFVILMNISRIIAWVHWPFDILVGTLLGIIGGFLSFKILTKIKFVKKLNFIIIKVSRFIKL